MAPKKSTIVLNVEQFIKDVEVRPAIWNRNFHCNKAFLEQMWDELSTEHSLPKVVLKAKWKGLRDNFRVEYKRIPRSDSGEFLIEPAVFESKWIHYYALLFLTEHMRHRMPKNEQDQSYFFTQQSQDCEKTVVEPDLTNGLIRRMHDSDEEFDEDDVEDDDDEIPETPPAAHSQSVVTNAIKTEETRSLLKTTTNNILKTQTDDVEKEAEDLSKKSTDKSKSITTNLSLPTANASSTPLTVNTSLPTQQHKIRSVSPPPLYNKAHHPQSAVTLTTTVLNKERDDFTLNSNTCLHGSHEHLNFTKHSYSNGLIPALKLKRPRLSEDSNFNGSSTMDNSPPLVPEDDDYHYLLSLYPYMKQLSAAQKLRTRTKIQKLIFKELYKEDLEESK